MLFFDSPYYRFGVDEADKNTQSQNQTSGSNRGKGWTKWWKTTLSTEDYLKFIASKVKHDILSRLYSFQVSFVKGSDYLGVVHHMYDSSGSDSEDEQHEKDKKQRLKELNEQLL